jgi:hypothetical protein
VLFSKSYQGLGIAFIHRMVGMRRLAKFFPCRARAHVFDQAAVKVADAPAGKAKRIRMSELMKVVIDELPVKSQIV